MRCLSIRLGAHQTSENPLCGNKVRDLSVDPPNRTNAVHNLTVGELIVSFVEEIGATWKLKMYVHATSVCKIESRARLQCGA